MKITSCNDLGLRESMKQSTTKGRDYENIMRDIEQQLAEKEAKLGKEKYFF